MVSSDRDPHEIDADEINVDNAARYGPLGEVEGATSYGSSSIVGAKLICRALWGQNKVYIDKSIRSSLLRCDASI